MASDTGTEISRPCGPVQVALPPPSPTPMELLAKALDKGLQPEMLEKLMDLQERHEGNQARKSFNNALADAKAEIKPVLKSRRVAYDAKNGGGRTDYSYEDLAAIAEAVDPILGKHGLSYRFRTESPIDRPIRVTCILSHRDGYSEENTLEGPRDSSGSKNALQGIGSTVTFLSRYTLKAAIGLAAAKDDDGQAAGGDSRITEDQLKELLTLKDNADADLEKLCAYFKIEALPDLPQSQFQNAKAALQAKVAQKAKAKGGAK